MTKHKPGCPRGTTNNPNGRPPKLRGPLVKLQVMIRERTHQRLASEAARRKLTIPDVARERLGD